MLSEIAIKVDNLSKCYYIYNHPRERLKQFFLSKLQRAIGKPVKNCFREFWALKEVSFEVKRGETVGIIGRNGSGKSTLLQMICGTLSPTSGNAQINGRIAALLELGSGFNPEFTGRENVYLNAALLGLTKSEVDERFDAIAAFAEIGAFIDQPVKTYSSGMYVRLAFAIQANVEPEILIVDEALAVGDAYFVHKCMLRFEQLQKSGTTILFVSHDATAVKTLCNSAIWLEDGRIVSYGVSSIVVDRYLAALKNQPLVMDFGEDSGAAKFEGTELPKYDFRGEKFIPNIDRRLGDQRCKFVGAAIYDERMQPLQLVENDSILIIRLTICNNSLAEGERLVVGFSLRNHRGIDLASNNSMIENALISAPSVGAHLTVRISFQLPILHPGSYALSISMGYWGDSGKIQDADSITNAIVFDLTSKRTVHVLMSLAASFETEG